MVLKTIKKGWEKKKKKKKKKKITKNWNLFPSVINMPSDLIWTIHMS